MTAYWAVLAAAIVISMAGQTLLKSGAGAADFIAQLLDWHTILGLALYGGSAMLYIVALRRIPMSVALPCTAISYVAAALIGLGVVRAGAATIVVTPTTNATTVVNALTAGGGQGVVVTAVNLQAHALSTGQASSGIFALSGPLPATYGMMLPGIILSSGNVADYGSGPYISGNTTAYGVPATPAQEALLNPITGTYPHYDVTHLDITFNTLPGFDKVYFQVVFGS